MTAENIKPSHEEVISAVPGVEREHIEPERYVPGFVDPRKTPGHPDNPATAMAAAYAENLRGANNEANHSRTADETSTRPVQDEEDPSIISVVPGITKDRS